MSLDERLEIIFAVTELLFFFIKNKSKRKYKNPIFSRLSFQPALAINDTIMQIP